MNALVQQLGSRVLGVLSGFDRLLLRGTLPEGKVQPDGERGVGRSFRSLNPYSPDDLKLLRLIADPRYVSSGLRNRDIREGLYGDSSDGSDHRRQSSRVSRKLRLLRAHGY